MQAEQELQELKSFAACLRESDASDIIYKLMKMKYNAERNGEEKADKKTQELMQMQIDALNLRIDEAKREVSNRYQTCLDQTHNSSLTQTVRAKSPQRSLPPRSTSKIT